MCIGGGSSGTPAYTPPTVTPTNATRPDEADAEVESAKISAQKKALAASGSEEDNLTGGLGVSGQATTKRRSLLGGAA